MVCWVWSAEDEDLGFVMGCVCGWEVETVLEEGSGEMEMDGSSEMIRWSVESGWFASSWWRQRRQYQDQACPNGEDQRCGGSIGLGRLTHTDEGEFGNSRGGCTIRLWYRYSR